MDKSNSLLKNTIALYIRMLFSVCVNVYISRVILDVLGVEDYGVYSVVGGVVILLGFINSSMAGATSRFLSVALGDGNLKRLSDTYNAAKHLHFGVAILILLLGETLGLWIVNSYLEIPEGRELAANIVYQLSLITVLFTIVQVPFSAIVISMERMDVYAKIEIANVLLKLAVVLLLPYCVCDRLLLYPLLLLVVAIIIYLLYKYYCRNAYQELKYDRTIRMNIIRPMLVYSGWDMLGWGGVSMSTQGRQIFINKFFGVTFNAANGLAATASGAIQAFTNNVIMAFRPRIMKYFAAQNYSEMQRLTELALIGTILLMTVIFVPMILCMDFLLGVWLVEVPLFTLEFCKLLLILQFLEAINTVVKIGIQASGKLRDFTIAGFGIHFFNLVLTYSLYLAGMNALTTYTVAIVLCVVNIAVNFYFSKRIIPTTNIVNLVVVCLKGVFVCLCGYFLSSMISTLMSDNGIINFIVVFVVNFTIVLGLSFVLYYTVAQQVLKSLLNNKRA